MSELWGFQSGQSQRQADDQSKGLYELGMAEGALKIETQKFALDNAKLMQQRQEQAIKMMQMAVPGTPGGGQANSDPSAATANTLYEMGNIEIQSGLIEQGGEHIKQGAALQENHLKILNEQDKMKIKKFDFAANLLQDVHDQTSWDQMKTIYQAQFSEPLDPKVSNQPYSPQLIDMLKSGAQTSLQKANERAAEARAKAAEATVKLDQVKIPYYVALKDQAVARTSNLKKVGAGQVLPKPTDVARVTDLITDSYPDTPKDKAHILAQSVAEEARRLNVEDGLPLSQAYKKSFNEAKSRGDFWGLREGKHRSGEDVSKPLEIPMKDGKADLDSMTNNAFYKDARYPDAVFVFDKGRGGLVRVAKEPAAKPTKAAAEDDDDTSEDDE